MTNRIISESVEDVRLSLDHYTATLLSRRPLNPKLRAGGFRPRHLNRSAATFYQHRSMRRNIQNSMTTRVCQYKQSETVFLPFCRNDGNAQKPKKLRVGRAVEQVIEPERETAILLLSTLFFIFFVRARLIRSLAVFWSLTIIVVVMNQIKDKLDISPQGELRLFVCRRPESNWNLELDEGAYSTFELRRRN